MSPSPMEVIVSAVSTLSVYGETPLGAVNGVNEQFTLAYTPVVGTVRLYYNGQRQSGPANFSVSGNAITMTFAPMSGSVLLVDYNYLT